MNRSNHKNGFTLIELLAALTIVAVLAAVAIPTYKNHIDKSYAQEAISYANKLKNLVSLCASQNNGAATNCSGGSFGIPANCSLGTCSSSYIDTADVTNGVIYLVDSRGQTLYFTFNTMTPQGIAIYGCSGTMKDKGYVDC